MSFRLVLMAGLLLAHAATADGGPLMHPACMEPLFGSLEAPLPSEVDIAACNRRHGDEPVYRRGEARIHSLPEGGHIGHEWLGRDGEWVLLRVLEYHGGSGSRSTVLLARHDAQAQRLRELQELSPGRGCAFGFHSAGPGGDGRLRLRLELTPGHLLKALVAPEGEIPRQGRDRRRALMIFGIEILKALPNRPGTCIGRAEYILDPGTGKWRPGTFHLATLRHFDTPGLRCLHGVLSGNSQAHPQGGWRLDVEPLPAALGQCEGVLLEGLPGLD